MTGKIPPLIVISGATGTGKTKLSIEIAKHYGGEIINADALQIYKGMDIATNKVTEAEAQGIPHHLLGFKNIEVLDFTIHEFQKLALDKINEIRERNKIPIIVGGTNYYIESILWQTLVHNDSKELVDNISIPYEFNNINNIELHKILEVLDENSAKILHHNDRRKVLRAIEIATNSPKTKSDYFDEQKNIRRFKLNEVIFLWIYSEFDCLFPRLDKRVDEMINMGLLYELQDIQKLFTQICPMQNYTKGIFQAIGFKEFHDYLNYANEDDAITKERILESCVENLKISTKKYVKYQNKWVNNRFLKKRSESINIPLFKLDSSNVSNWEENVLQRSLRIIEQIINSTNDSSYSSFIKQLSISPEPLSDQVKYSPIENICEICDNQIFKSEQQWNAHLHSRRHQKRVKTMKKKFEKDIYSIKSEI